MSAVSQAHGTTGGGEGRVANSKPHLMCKELHEAKSPRARLAVSARAVLVANNLDLVHANVFFFFFGEEKMRKAERRERKRRDENTA